MACPHCGAQTHTLSQVSDKLRAALTNVITRLQVPEAPALAMTETAGRLEVTKPVTASHLCGTSALLDGLLAYLGAAPPPPPAIVQVVEVMAKDWPQRRAQPTPDEVRAGWTHWQLRKEDSHEAAWVTVVCHLDDAGRVRCAKVGPVDLGTVDPACWDHFRCCTQVAGPALLP